METLVNLIIQNSKTQDKGVNPRQIFFRDFDRLLKLATQGESVTSSLEQLERYGREAGMSSLDLAQRKDTLLWTAAQAA